MTEQRIDFSEYAAEHRVLHWKEFVAADADTDALVDEAIGHAVGLRDTLYERNADADACTRALMLVAVLNRLRDGR
jgi:hypothetical protein